MAIVDPQGVTKGRTPKTGTRLAAAVWIVAAGSMMTACSPQEQVLHGKLSQLTPTICVAAPRATGECFDPSSADTSGLALGDCVMVRYVAAKDPTAPARIKRIEKEQCV